VNELGRECGKTWEGRGGGEMGWESGKGRIEVVGEKGEKGEESLIGREEGRPRKTTRRRRSVAG
jgi:hypothetical protein